MSAGRRIVITGISNPWATELARRLERDSSVEMIAGIDTEPPAADLERTEFIEADVRSPVLSRLLPSTEADTVVHCGFLWYPAPGKPDRALHDINVIGALQLLTACERTESLQTLIVRGSAAIYGCEGAAPLFFKEEMARRYPLKTRFQRDVGELENYFENFARRNPQVTVMMLRYQPTLGMAIDSPLTRYLQQAVVPTQLGYDPLLQFVHAQDAISALEAAVRRPAGGPVNVAGEGSVSLSRLLRLTGRIPLPVPAPLFGAALTAAARFGLARLPPEAGPWLRNGVTLDCTRLVEEVGFRPRSTLDAVMDFVGEVRGRGMPRDVRAAPIGVAGA
jgi:UDP-glucose 4-epimerase